ncbi:MAG: DinB family protein [Caldilineaceae bacterium]
MKIHQIFLERHAAVHSSSMNAEGWWKEEDRVWSNLTEAELRCRPTPAHNAIAWVLWHMARCEDVAVNTVIRGAAEVLDRNGWLDQLGISSRHIGTGATTAEVDVIRNAINLTALRQYRAAVGRETQTWAATLDFDSLDKLVTANETQRAIDKDDFGVEGAWVGPFWAKVTWTHATFLFWLAIEHNWYHIGEIRVIRSLLNHPGN